MKQMLLFVGLRWLSLLLAILSVTLLVLLAPVTLLAVFDWNAGWVGKVSAFLFAQLAGSLRFFGADPKVVAALEQVHALASEIYTQFIRWLEMSLDGTVRLQGLAARGYEALQRFAPKLASFIPQPRGNGDELRALAPYIKAGVRTLLAEGWLVVIEIAIAIQLIVFSVWFFYRRKHRAPPRAR